MRRLDGKVAIISGSTGGQEYAALCPEANRRAAPRAGVPGRPPGKDHRLFQLRSSRPRSTLAGWTYRPLAQTFFDWNPLASLAPLSSGELEVLDTADGFEVSLSGKARSWVTFLPLVVFALGTGGLTFTGTPLRWLPAVGGVVLLALAWVRTRVSLSRFLDMTNEEIAESFAATPPPLHAGDGGPPWAK